MRNDEQQPPQGQQAPTSYTGWSYDQESPQPPRSPIGPPPGRTALNSQHPSAQGHNSVPEEPQNPYGPPPGYNQPGGAGPNYSEMSPAYGPPGYNPPAGSPMNHPGPPPGYVPPPPGYNQPGVVGPNYTEMSPAYGPPGYNPSMGSPQNPYGPPPGYVPPPNYNPQQQIPSSPYYPTDLSMDIGSSLGYGQTMEFRALSVPQPQQPSSPVPKMRQAALQQQREERMRRQQRRMNPDATTVLRRKERQALQDKRADMFPGGVASAPGATPSQFYSPLSAAPGLQEQSLPGVNAQVSPLVLQGSGLPAAAAPAQDTGMIQRVSVARASFLITSATGISSVLGLLQTFLFTYVLGRSAFSDAYLQAYIVPNLIYTVISGGALSSAFIPVFASYSVGKNDENAAWHIASSALNISAVLMIILSGLAALLAPVLVPLYCPAPTFSPQDISLIVILTRIMLLQAVVLGSGVIVGSVLNSKQNFTRTALGTVLYNVGLIIGLLPGFIQTFHTRSSNPTDLAVYAATWGVVLGAVLNVGVQVTGLPSIHMRYSFAFDWRHPGVIQIARQMVPRIINAVMLSFSTAVDRFLLAFLGAVVATNVLNGLINEYFQAFSILLLPVSIFGSSVSTATFPTLSSYVARERFDRVRVIIMETLRNILFLTVPSAVGLIVLAFPIVQVLLEHGNFDRVAAEFSAVALLFFAIGLPALASVEIFTRSFYALQDSRTPVIISVAQFILKIALSIILINLAAFGIEWGVGALAFSTSIASTLEALVLFILLYQRIGGFDLRALMGFVGRIFVASAALTVVLLVLRFTLDRLIDTTSMKTLFIPGILMALVKLLIELGIGSATFLIVARLLHMEELNGGLVRRVLNLLRIPWL